MRALERPFAPERVARYRGRVVYLQAGSFKGFAGEAALQRLGHRDGQVASWAEGAMCVRHGLETFVSAATAFTVVVFGDRKIRAHGLQGVRIRLAAA